MKKYLTAQSQNIKLTDFSILKGLTSDDIIINKTSHKINKIIFKNKLKAIVIDGEINNFDFIDYNNNKIIISQYNKRLNKTIIVNCVNF